ncbi:plasma membrane, autoregulation-binding site, misato segment II, myosin-like, tubulin/FtsZ protein [Wolffia australiana]
MREIVTLQVGCFSNFIGSHFWNFQDELLGLAEEVDGDPVFKSPSLNLDTIYRYGETRQGYPTYTPRLVSIGFQGSLGSLSSADLSSYDIPSSRPSEIVTWTGEVSKVVAQPHKKNLFLQRLCEEGTSSYASGKGESSVMEDKQVTENLENSVHYWTDFSKAHYHHRSLHELHASWGTVQQFNNYGAGKQLLTSNTPEADDIIDRLRFFVEECDHMQGIQCVADDSGGFSGVAADLLEHIADEYPNNPVLLFSARNTERKPVTRAELVKRSLHDAVSFSMLSGLSSLTVPIGLPSLSSSKAAAFLGVDDAKPFHTSAVYAASIHSIGLPLRMEPPGPASNSCDVIGAIDLGQLVQMLSGQSWRNKVIILDGALPAPGLEGPLLSNLHPLTPETAAGIDDPRAVESLVIQGALISGRRPNLHEVESLIQKEYESYGSARFSHLALALCPLPVPLPFPSFFNEASSIPMAARLRSTAAILPFLRRRCDDLRRLGFAGSGAGILAEWGIARGEAEELAEAMATMTAELDPHPELSSESD